MSATLLAACTLQPQPLSPAAVQSYAADKLARLTVNQEPIAGSIGLDEAIARGLKYNLDFRVENFQVALRDKDLVVNDYKLLPNLVAESNYLGRNNELAAYSRSVTTRQVTLEPSVSTPKNDVISDLTLSYNTLDFGLSYVRAKQAGDEVLIARETRRKVINRIVQDIRTAYWRAYSAQRLSGRLHELEARVRRAIADSHALEKGLDGSPLAALTYERELVEIKRQAQAIESDMSVAKAQLAALMNVPPTERFTLSGRASSVRTRVFREPLDELVAVALVNRPELREAQYNSRINVQESKVALLQLLPNAEFYFGGNNDTSNFLYNPNWLAYGARTSFNLISVFRYPAHIQQIEGQGKLLDARALALTMAVITQVQVSRVRLFEAERELSIAEEFLNVQGRLLSQIKAEAVTEKGSEQSLIREQMNKLVAEARRDLAYAAYENAYGLVFEAVGLDPYHGQIDEQTSVHAIATAINSNWIDGGNRLKAANPGPLRPLPLAYKPRPVTLGLRGSEMPGSEAPAFTLADAPAEAAPEPLGLK